MNTIQTITVKSPIGVLRIEETGGVISSIGIHKENAPIVSCTSSSVLNHCVDELRAYFDGKLKRFTVPVIFLGTEFQQRVWKALQEIPYGQTQSYKELAELIGARKAYRAVGNAANKNPILIIVPCHRLIGSDGSLTGFACGIEAKRFLLEMEKDLQQALR
ncbi:methylated-DNA--[protein]-cysteine S-methyltransferase [Treponema phagedenis]|uniref:Methylated-DNA--protein-cysteine methyltransferase n=1 Tax=Treponema phagedenis TaxID=162 RepID=A0A0B7GYU2_TREPH|nr:methylated-DNA--[protein]-cysteine S-methyltransferase [Treponema phagedenis]NVP23397.1 methylated-DNA--[protein]-cysteine S-methyltransferase [Treponema phagedenis]QEJ98540.1 methylated-DNA--[protein]-cysteine S-methyltransferase [Treponema phagedenis]QEK04045.1 methylated-DNA--[protein]-cysteine S-methyltransferase [Treponema phagedenis]QEK09662.1 methylated-DNA--[protein]-cysteine S-methyltransferase [Treponema phagedenis]QKS92834.1 methylated-DNA--[protein]-cysteine S-methyltransferase 